MFVVTVINFLLSSLYTGIKVAIIIGCIQKTFTLDIHYPLLERGKSIGEAVQNLAMVGSWSANLPVSSNLSLWIPCLFMVGEGIIQWSHCHLEGLGPLPRSMAYNSNTTYAVDWSCGWIDIFREAVSFCWIDLYAPRVYLEQSYIDIHPSWLRLFKSCNVYMVCHNQFCKPWALHRNERPHDDDDCVYIVVRCYERDS